MEQLLFYGFLCALAPWLLARFHFLLAGLTLPLVYLLALVQVLIVPVMVALDPDISFGSDVYSLGAGISIVLIAGIEFVFLVGTGVGLLTAISFIRRREKDATIREVERIFGK